MPLLPDLLYRVSLLSTAGDPDVEVKNVCFDSRKVQPGDLFVATRGATVDGHAYVEKALAAGAAAVVAEVLPAARRADVTYVQVRDSREALGMIAGNLHGHPAAKLKLVGVTGTNGKTTVATLLHRLFRKLGYTAGLISTVQNQINEAVIPATHTTPDALATNALLAEMVRQGCTYAFMEVSSHAADQRRIAGLKFAGALFTNITHDHLDYHGTFDAYIAAKKLFFDHLDGEAFALVNDDDRRGRVMLQNTRAAKYFFALRTDADFKGKVLSNTLQGLEVDMNGKPVWFQLIGEFNAYNLLAVWGAAVLLGEDADEVLTQLSDVRPATGRFDQVVFPGGVIGIIDYAHTPDALENVLRTVGELRTGAERVITVVGCGGNRDKGKRPVMAGLAVQHSDRVLLTSDNPRDEAPEAIIADMQAGVGPSEARKVRVIVDRRAAIEAAAAEAEPGDIVLVAGKGHETYQEVRGVRHPFDDRQVLREAFGRVGKS
ncbi:MAG: UDP-N-acetylmuramoyl-L-alanyl-D-glutamate--2,6-diaminopimelate ligase [Catalinimonas sp.]